MNAVILMFNDALQKGQMKLIYFGKLCDFLIYIFTYMWSEVETFDALIEHLYTRTHGYGQHARSFTYPWERALKMLDQLLIH